jgi:hypothetical protein
VFGINCRSSSSAPWSEKRVLLGEYGYSSGAAHGAAIGVMAGWQAGGRAARRGGDGQGWQDLAVGGWWAVAVRADWSSFTAFCTWPARGRVRGGSRALLLHCCVNTLSALTWRERPMEITAWEVRVGRCKRASRLVIRALPALTRPCSDSRGCVARDNLYSLALDPHLPNAHPRYHRRRRPRCSRQPRPGRARLGRRRCARPPDPCPAELTAV